jgi:hypothetical protein
MSVFVCSALAPMTPRRKLCLHMTLQCFSFMAQIASSTAPSRTMLISRQTLSTLTLRFRLKFVHQFPHGSIVTRVLDGPTSVAVLLEAAALAVQEVGKSVRIVDGVAGVEEFIAGGGELSRAASATPE